jgi:NAD+-dependent protein deacetylase SIR2
LTRPEDLFTLSFFLDNPKVFYEFSREFELEGYHPTPTHFFIKLLDTQGQLTMNLTQNIDNLEEKAGIDPNKLSQAHGCIKGAACGKC